MSRNPYKNPNPQGKGLVSVLAHWADTRPARVRSKTPAELLFDWFASALVLSAEFRFKPALGQRYFLYARDGGWHMSLIGPAEWGDRQVGDCLGACELRDDMTWSITPDPMLGESSPLQAALATMVEGFMQTLNSDASLEETLPGYRRDLPYFQRMLATGLGSSLRQSVADTALLKESPRFLLSGAAESIQQRLGLVSPLTDLSGD